MPSNPFIVNRPVSPEHFIGREKEVKDILDRLASSAPGSTAISGEPGIGKTSLLHYVCSPQAMEKWGFSPEKCAFVFIDTRTIVPFKPDSFWRYILKSLATQQIYDRKRIESLLKNRGKKVGTFELGDLFDRIAQDGKLIVLLLDGFEHVIEYMSPDNPDFLNLLRALINRPIRGLALVLASHKPLTALLRDFRFSTSPFPTSFTSLSLHPFSQAEADKLIETYTRGTGGRFSREEMERVYTVSEGHPGKLQRACYELFEQKTRGRWFQLRKPTIHGLFQAFINMGLVVSAILFVFASALWYQYIYQETIVGTQITADGIIGYSVGYPEWIGVGDMEQFRIALTNEGPNPLSNVRTYLDFSAANVVPPSGRSLTVDLGSLPVKERQAGTIEFCLETADGNNMVQSNLLFTSDESGKKFLDTYTFKVIGVPYMENLRGPKNLIRQFLKGVGALVGAFLTALVISWATKIGSSREEG